MTVGATDADFAATTTGAGCMGDPCSIFQAWHPLGRIGTAPSDGVVVRWRIRVHSLLAAANATTHLRLVGPTTNPLAWGSAGPQLDVPDAPQLPQTISQDLRLPIVKGQGIAPQFQTVSGGNVFVAGRDDAGGATSTLSPPPPPGGSGNGSNPSAGRLLAVAADVESDADADGFGDETQDGCPTDAATQGACQPADPGDVTGPALEWCGAPRQNLARSGAIRACVETSELAAIEATGAITLGKPKRRAKPILLPAAGGAVAPGSPTFVDLELNKKARGKVKRALARDRHVSADVVVTGTDAAGNGSQVEGRVLAKG